MGQFVCERRTHVEWEVSVCVCVEGGREVVVGVRFTLVRLAPVDIPDIPTSRMLEAPPSSSSMLGAVEDPGGLLCHRAHTDTTETVVEQKPHTL